MFNGEAVAYARVKWYLNLAESCGGIKGMQWLYTIASQRGAWCIVRRGEVAG